MNRQVIRFMEFENDVHTHGEFQHIAKQIVQREDKVIVRRAAVPVFGANPIKAQILTQVFNVFVVPLVIIGIIILINKKELMGEHKAGAALNTGMILALIFACIISYNGVIAILENI